MGYFIRKFDLGPAQWILLSFLVVITLGALVLKLPISNVENESIEFIDALFTSTSAVCVTGLVVVDTVSQWTNFGKLVIMILIQIGGLGFMTIVTMVLIIFGKRISLSERLLMKEALSHNKIKGVITLTKSIIKGTLVIELTGFFLLTLVFLKKYEIKKAMFLGAFHSVSAFCNAGFDILSESSLTGYYGDILLNITVIILIILGGLGFSVWVDIFGGKNKGLNPKKIFMNLTLHTKLVLTITSILIIVPAILFFIFEIGNTETFMNLSNKNRLLASLFQSVTTRTAGFNTFDLAKMQEVSKFLTIILMFIGGSPASTAGGIKTITFGIVVLLAISTIKGKKDVEIFRRRIPEDIIRRGIALIILSLLLVIIVTMSLLILEGDKFNFMEVLFESVSAFATVGLSLGITSEVSSISKMIIIITMFIGRLGPVTFILALQFQNKKNTGVKQPEEKVIIG